MLQTACKIQGHRKVSYPSQPGAPPKRGRRNSAWIPHIFSFPRLCSFDPNLASSLYFFSQDPSRPLRSTLLHIIEFRVLEESYVIPTWLVDHLSGIQFFEQIRVVAVWLFWNYDLNREKYEIILWKFQFPHCPMGSIQNSFLGVIIVQWDPKGFNGI